jgi:hypothetical protein
MYEMPARTGFPNNQLCAHGKYLIYNLSKRTYPLVLLDIHWTSGHPFINPLVNKAVYISVNTGHCEQQQESLLMGARAPLAADDAHRSLRRR